MAKRKRQKMTAEERAAQEEHQKFIDEVIADVARRAGIENTPEARRRHIESTIGRLRPRPGA